MMLHALLAHLSEIRFVRLSTLEAGLIVCLTGQTANAGKHAILLDHIVTRICRDGTADEEQGPEKEGPARRH